MPGAKVLVASQGTLLVADRHREPVDDEVGCCAHGDQRTAVADEALQAVDADIADAAAVLRADGRAKVAVDDFTRQLVGEDDHVELAPESASAQIGVVKRGVGNSYCSRTQRVHPSSMLPLVHGA